MLFARAWRACMRRQANVRSFARCHEVASHGGLQRRTGMQKRVAGGRPGDAAGRVAQRGRLVRLAGGGGGGGVVVVCTYEAVPQRREGHSERMPQAVRVHEAQEGREVQHLEERREVDAEHKGEERAPACMRPTSRLRVAPWWTFG